MKRRNFIKVAAIAAPGLVLLPSAFIPKHVEERLILYVYSGDDKEPIEYLIKSIDAKRGVVHFSERLVNGIPLYTEGGFNSGGFFETTENLSQWESYFKKKGIGAFINTWYKDLRMRIIKIC